MSARRHAPRRARERGFSFVEIAIAALLGALVMVGLNGAVGAALAARAEAEARVEAVRAAEFAMERMVGAIARSDRLLLPLAENAGTAWKESQREPGVLAVALDPAIDRDRDGIADADNDGDGRIDEDTDKDTTNDLASGIVGIDDDGDGSVDEGAPDAGGKYPDDDEDGVDDDDPADGLDADGDGAIDEDVAGDMNGDSRPGVADVDDDGDGSVDEGVVPDDDEDGAVNEDWIDAVVYYLNAGALVERMPDPGATSGADYTERVIAENVTRFRVERLAPAPSARALLVELTLDLAGADGDTVSLVTRTRVGGRR